ncbi:MAG TPA: Ig-like domain-containing protein, partial [Gemmatimonadales bacterium]|nr:Ig-like domain-containing protein [Gemmatimonadales bacterium]
MAALLSASLVGVACADYVFAPGERAVRGIQLSPTQITLNPGQSTPISATLLDQFDSSFTGLPAGVQLHWSSANPPVATVDGTGKVTADSTGSAQIIADVTGDFGTFSATVSVTVLPSGSVATISVTPVGPTIASGSTQQLTATPRDSAGNPLPVPVVWGSSDSTVASVNGTGLVTGHLVGKAVITAAAGGKSGTDSVTVVPGPASPATSLIVVTAPTIPAGDSVTFTLTTKDAAGNARTAGGDSVTFSTTGGTSL